MFFVSSSGTPIYFCILSSHLLISRTVVRGWVEETEPEVRTPSPSSSTIPNPNPNPKRMCFSISFASDYRRLLSFVRSFKTFWWHVFLPFSFIFYLIRMLIDHSFVIFYSSITLLFFCFLTNHSFVSKYSNKNKVNFFSSHK